MRTFRGWSVSYTSNASIGPAGRLPSGLWQGPHGVKNKMPTTVAMIRAMLRPAVSVGMYEADKKRFEGVAAAMRTPSR